MTTSTGPCIVTAVGPLNVEGAPATAMQLSAPQGVAPDGLVSARASVGVDALDAQMPWPVFRREGSISQTRAQIRSGVFGRMGELRIISMGTCR